ncbi:MAG TPA: hypothetical protein VLJ17_16725 [Xanthobacteraceae bacterium]|nr:hypothetical protein [Xanthobacteraceae bacterium]
MTEEREYELEVWQSGLMVASVHGPDFDFVHGEAMHYALQYAQDGPVEIRGIPADKFEQVKAEATGRTP